MKPRLMQQSKAAFKSTKRSTWKEHVVEQSRTKPKLLRQIARAKARQASPSIGQEHWDLLPGKPATPEQRAITVTEYDIEVLGLFKRRLRLTMLHRFKRRAAFRAKYDPVLCRLAWYCLFLVFFTLNQITDFQDRFIFESGAAVDEALRLKSDSVLLGEPLSFQDVANAEDFYEYLRAVLLPALYGGGTDRAGINGPDSVGLLLGQLPVVGGVRISQLRLQDTRGDGKCGSLALAASAGRDLKLPCWGNAGRWQDDLENTNDLSTGLPAPQAAVVFSYSGSLLLRNASDGAVSSPTVLGSNRTLQLGASFYSVQQERDFALGYGGLRTEGGGDYPAPAYHVVLPHPRSPNASRSAQTAVQLLQAGGYIGFDTRLVTVSLTVYSPTVDRFVSYTLYVEMLATGNAAAGRALRTARLFSLTMGRTAGDVFLEVVVAMFFALFVAEQMMLVCTSPDGLGELAKADSALLTVNIALYVMTWSARTAAFYATPDLESIQWDSDVYYGLAAASGLRQLALSFVAVNSFVCFFKLAHFLSELPQFALVTQTLYKAVRPILAFMVVFGVLFFGFAAAYLLVFGSQLQGYSNIRESSYSLMLALLGEVPLSELESVSAWWGPAFTVTFVLVCTFVVLNVFIAIVTEGYDEVKAHLEQSRARTFENDLWWYMADSLLALPACGPTLDYRFRWCFSAVRARRRVLRQNAAIERKRQQLEVGIRKKRGDMIDDSSTPVSRTGATMPALGKDKPTHASAAHLAQLRRAKHDAFREEIKQPVGLFGCCKLMVGACQRRGSGAVHGDGAARWTKYEAKVHEVYVAEQEHAQPPGGSSIGNLCMQGDHKHKAAQALALLPDKRPTVAAAASPGAEHSMPLAAAGGDEDSVDELEVLESKAAFQGAT